MFLEQSRDAVEKAYEKVKKDLRTPMEQVDSIIEKLGEKERLAVKYLYAAMPYSDVGNYPVSVFLDFACHGVWLYDHKRAVRNLPEPVFLQYVLHHRVNEEEIRPCRKEFYRQLEQQIDGKNPKEAALEVNYWCAGEVTYQSGDDRTLSAMAVYRRGYGRCGEESVFTVNALRSAGIPARQVYAPCWSHCDDNHAWVEVWVDGQWHFMGACEPEPRLDLGWFEYAASRAMMVHARKFGYTLNLPFPEETDQKEREEKQIGTEGMVLMENVLSRYADHRKRIEVTVLDRKDCPVKDTDLWFEVLNYAAFRPIAKCRTDRHGKVSLYTGSGSIHLFAAAGKWYGEAVMDTRETTDRTLYLDRLLEGDSKKEFRWESYDMVPPDDRAPVSQRPDPEEKRNSRERLKVFQKKQEKKRREWKNAEVEAFLSWLGKRPDLEQKAGRQLLNILTDKDRTDVRCEVLIDHLEGAMKSMSSYPENVFLHDILNPRVEDEILTDYRRWFQKNIDREKQNVYRKHPRMLWNQILQEIREEPEHERSSVITTPKACFCMKCGSMRSKRVLFTAMARSMGIPARLCPEDGTVQYWKDGTYLSAEGERKDAVLVLGKGKEQEWIYEQNWSVTRLTRDNQGPLHLQNKKWENGICELHVRPGIYRIVTAERLPNGILRTKQCNVSLSSGEKKQITLESRKIRLCEMLESLPLPDFPVRGVKGDTISFQKLENGEEHILIWARAGEEPTEHLLNEMLEEKERFSGWSSRILCFVESERDFRQPLLKKVLTEFPDIRVYYDDFQEHVPSIGRRLYVDHEKLPIIAVTDGSRKAVYSVSGYQVGIGNLILRILQERK